MKKTLILLLSTFLSLGLFAQSNEAITAYNNAIKAYKAEDFYGAISLLETTADKEPTFLQAQEMLARCHSKVGNQSDARKYYTRIVDKQPRHYKIWYAIALTHIKEDNKDLARTTLNKVLDIKPNHAKAQRQLSYLKSNHIGGGEEKEATPRKVTPARLTSSTSKNAVSGTSKKYANKGIGYYNEKQFKEAALALNKAVEVSEKPSPKLYAYAARANMHTGKTDMAISQLKKAIAIDSDQGSHYYYLSKAYEMKGVENLAKKNADMAKTRGFQGTDETFNNAATKHYNLAVDLYHAKKYVESVKEYKRAIAENPNQAKYYYNMAVALLKMNRIKEARNALNDCMGVDGTYGLAYKLMGDLLYEDQKFRKAASYYEEAITLGQTTYNAYMNVGYCFDKLAVYKKALEYFIQAEKLNPTHKEVRFSVAIGYFKADKITEAKDRFKKLLADYPEDVRCLKNTSTICARMGQFEEGLEYAMRWIKADPTDGEAYNHAGDLLMNLRRGDEADKYKRKAKSLGVIRDPHWY